MTEREIKEIVRYAKSAIKKNFPNLDMELTDRQWAGLFRNILDPAKRGETIEWLERQSNTP